MRLRTISEIHDAKRGVAEQLDRAAEILRRPGVDLDDVRDAMVPVIFARLTLLACETALTGEASRNAASPCHDVMMAAAGDHTLDEEEPGSMPPATAGGLD